MLPNLRAPPSPCPTLEFILYLVLPAALVVGVHPELVTDSEGGARPVLRRLRSARQPLTLGEGRGGPKRRSLQRPAAGGFAGSLPTAKMALAAARRVLLHAGAWSGRGSRCTAPERAGFVGGGGERLASLLTVLRAVHRIPPRAQGGLGRRAALR